MIKLTVLFNEPFYEGIFEKTENGEMQICRVIFGEEPKDYEIYDFIIKNFNNLKFSKPILHNEKHEIKINPKRMQKKINKVMHENGIGTKAQQVLKLDYESKKIERKFESKEKHELEEKIKFHKKQEKKKQKKRGH